MIIIFFLISKNLNFKIKIIFNMFYILKFKFFWSLKYYFFKKFFKFFVFYFFESITHKYLWLNVNFLKKNLFLKNKKKLFFLFFNNFNNFHFFSFFKIIFDMYFLKYDFFIIGYLSLYQINYINDFNNFYFILNKNVLIKKNNIYF